jgi:hypothetical protein
MCNVCAGARKRGQMRVNRAPVRAKLTSDHFYVITSAYIVRFRTRYVRFPDALQSVGHGGDPDLLIA